MATPKAKKGSTEAWLNAREAATALGCTIQRLAKLVASGVLVAERDESGELRYDPIGVSELEAFSDQTGEKKDALVEQLTKALKEQGELVKGLVGIVVEPTQRTHEALLQENRALREEKTMLAARQDSVSEMYAALLREQASMTLEREQAQADQKLKTEALDMAKAQIPIITEGLLASKFVAGIPSEVLEAFIEEMPPAQASLARKLIAARKAREERKNHGSSADTTANGRAESVDSRQ